MTKNYKKSKWKTIGYILYVALVVLLALELLLRMYNPFHFRIKGSNIVLETNKTYHIDNSANPRLDKSKVASDNGILLIDLAWEMPKSSLYFYDLVHFTNKGCEEVSSIISKALSPVLHQYTHQ
jgi:hypothetical protein